jgi:uncharacterized small protein (TIGR04563 family)
MCGGMPDQCRQNIYFQNKILAEIVAEAQRLDRSMSWVVQRAWKIAAGEIKKIEGRDSHLHVERRA